MFHCATLIKFRLTSLDEMIDLKNLTRYFTRKIVFKLRFLKEVLDKSYKYDLQYFFVNYFITFPNLARGEGALAFAILEFSICTLALGNTEVGSATKLTRTIVTFWRTNIATLIPLLTCRTNSKQSKSRCAGVKF